jgi:hypothetical protein
VPGVAALLAALLTGCTGDSGSGGTTADGKSAGGSTTAPAAQPGKFATLPEPCGSVSRATLQRLLPSVTGVAKTQLDAAYAGTPAVTFDTDRQVGCRWNVESDDGLRHLRVDYERVVSYDSTVSDDNRASEVYEEKATAARIPETSPSASESPSDSASGPASATPGGSTSEPGQEPGSETESPAPSASAPVSASESPGASAGASVSPTASATVDSLAPRRLTGLADAAFLDDQVAKSGSTMQTRTITIVFRASNAVVTIEYAEQPSRTTDVPDSKQLQDRALSLAGELARRFTE